MRITRMYVNEAGIVQIAQSGTRFDLFFGLASQRRRDAVSGMYLARHPAFPQPVGAGESWETATHRLRAAFNDFMQRLIETEGLERFESRLLKDGFERLDEETHEIWDAGHSTRIMVYSMVFRTTLQRAG